MGYGWSVQRVGDANDTGLLARAFEHFAHTDDRPTLIIVDSHIGYGAPSKQDTSAAHGEPLGEDEIRGAKRRYGWPEDAKFLVPAGVREHFAAGIGARGAEQRKAWQALRAAYAKEFPQLADHLDRMQRRELPDGWDKDLPTFPADAKGLASRDSSGKVLNVVTQNVPWLIGGAADLFPSTKTRLTLKGAGDFEAEEYGGHNFHFGIREHGMCAILNGMSLSKVRPFGSGFFIFTDYARPSIRLAAFMELPVIFIFTHDSIGVGEDGPTHQPVEQLASLRAIPNLLTMRPGDANEVVEAWRFIMPRQHEPVMLVLSRQNLPTLDRTKYAPAAGLAKGAYVLADPPQGAPDVLLIATGSEVGLCVTAYEDLTKRGVKARVVSHAVLGAVRAPAAGLPRRGAAAVGHRPRRRRAGLDARLGALRRTERRHHRHAHVRRVGTAQGRTEEVRLRAGSRGRGGARAVGEEALTTAEHRGAQGTAVFLCGERRDHVADAKAGMAGTGRASREGA